MAESEGLGVSSRLGGIETASFKPLSFALHIVPGTHGPLDEIRTYGIAPGGLPETEAACSRVVDCLKELSPLFMVTGSVDTPPTCMMHLQSHRSLDGRARVRTEADSQDTSPPPGGSAHVLFRRSEIFAPPA